MSLCLALIPILLCKCPCKEIVNFLWRLLTLGRPVAVVWGQQQSRYL
jgi:hypothetical protein